MKIAESSWIFPELLEQIKIDNKRLIIYGAGGTALHELSSRPEIVEFVDYFVDADKTKTFLIINGKTYQVKHPECLFREKDIVVLIMLNDFINVEKMLENFPVIGTAYSWYTRKITHDEFIAGKYVKTALEIEKDIMLCNNIKAVNTTDENYWNNRVADYSSVFCQNGKVIVPNVIMILSNVCNLRCEKCSMLMPKFKTPWQMDYEDAIKYIDNFLRGCDECLSFNLIGGETMAYKHLAKVIEYCCQKAKIKSVRFVTNATIVPNEETLCAMQNDKVFVLISHYPFTDKYMTNTARTIDVFRKNKIRFRSQPIPWIDTGDIQKRHKCAGALEYEFLNCCYSVCTKTLLLDKLFACERSARMYSLGGEYVDSKECDNDFTTLPLEQSDNTVRERVRSILTKKSASACDYCDFGLKYANYVLPGIQIAEVCE